MSADEIYFWWYVWLAVGAVVVVAAAALLITVIVLAHKIAKLASVALEVVVEIERNTKSIWQLNATNQVTGKLLVGAKAIESNAGSIVEALSEADLNNVA